MSCVIPCLFQFFFYHDHFLRLGKKYKLKKKVSKLLLPNTIQANRVHHNPPLHLIRPCHLSVPHPGDLAVPRSGWLASGRLGSRWPKQPCPLKRGWEGRGVCFSGGVGGWAEGWVWRPKPGFPLSLALRRGRAQMASSCAPPPDRAPPPPFTPGLFQAG